MQKKLQKPYPTDYDLLIPQDLWQAHYQVFLIILMKEFIKLTVNTSTMIKKRGTCKINYKYCDCFIEYSKFKDAYVLTRIIKRILMKS